MVNVYIYTKYLPYDRYHLVNPRAQSGVPVIDKPTVYDESGVAFNGFDRPFILNISAETLYDSRMGKFEMNGFNGENPVYFLINDVKPITVNKCAVYFEIDGWTNYKNSGTIIGPDNYLFESTKQIDYPYEDLTAKFKTINFDEKIQESEYFDVVMLYHYSQMDSDTVYIFRYPRYIGFDFYGSVTKVAMESLQLDSNEIIGIYLSPFEIYTTGSKVYEAPGNGLEVYKLEYNNFITERLTIPVVKNHFIADNFAMKTVITDMTGSPVWYSVRSNNGNRKFVARLDLRYDGCVWDCTICGENDSLTDYRQLCPNNRFSISCVDLGYFVDYYQQYQNIQKSTNSELRKAQLEKQLIDDIGGVISSTTSGTIGGLIGGSSIAGAGAGAIGGIASMATAYYSTSDYNRKLEIIENKQALMQYDTMIPCSNSFFPFILGESEPAFNLMMIDSQSQKSQTYDDSNPYIKYNCRIRQQDLWEMIYTGTPPKYISGDFDFVGMNINIARQLNERFKHGVYFMD